MLEEYGNDVDAAIKRLNELQLGGARDTDPTGGAPPLAPDSHPSAAQEQEERRETGVPSPPPSPAAHSAAEWVEEVVGEMTAARSVEDARARAARVLEAFERGVLLHAAKQVPFGDRWWVGGLASHHVPARLHVAFLGAPARGMRGDLARSRNSYGAPRRATSAAPVTDPHRVLPARRTGPAPARGSAHSCRRRGARTRC